MSFDPDEEEFNLNKMREELYHIEQENARYAAFLRDKELKLQEDSQARIRGYRQDVSNMYKATQNLEARLEAKSDALKEKLDDERRQRKLAEKERRIEHWEEMERLYYHDLKHKEMRQQYLVRDSQRERDDLRFTTEQFGKAIDHKITLENTRTDNLLKRMEQGKHHMVDIMDSHTRYERARGNAEMQKLLTADAQKSAHEKLLASNQSAERSINNLIKNGTPVYYRTNRELTYY